MTTFFYRENGGEVIKKSDSNHRWPNRNVGLFGVALNPQTPDGTELLSDRGDGTFGDNRELGYCKIYVAATHTVRNASSAEIKMFITAETEDDDTLLSQAAAEMVAGPGPMGRLVSALIDDIAAPGDTTVQRVAERITGR